MYRGSVEWVIGNPPYSVFEDFLKKGFEISNNVSYLVPTNKIFQRQKIMNMITKYGGIKSIIVYGSGQLIDFPFGFSVANFHFKKDYEGDAKIIMGMKNIFNNKHLHMIKDQIKAMSCLKHIKIYLFSKIGLTNKEISKEIGSGAGHVYNVLKDYKDHPEKAEHAESLIVESVE